MNNSDVRLNKIYHRLRERICVLDYAPGERLSEHTLAAEFKVSRTPVRRVLTRLQSEGLLDIRHGAGNFVTEIEFGYLCEAYRLRMELAPLIGQLSPNKPGEDMLERFRALQNEVKTIVHSKAPKREFARINILHFELLIEIVGNRPLKQITEHLFYRTARMWPALLQESEVENECNTLFDEMGESLRLLERDGVTSIGFLRRVHIEVALDRLLKLYPKLEEASNAHS